MKRIARQQRQTKTRLLSLPVDEFIEDGRVLKALLAAGVNTVGDLMRKTEDEVRAMPGMGRGLLSKLKQELQDHMLHLRS